MLYYKLSEPYAEIGLASAKLALQIGYKGPISKSSMFDVRKHNYRNVIWFVQFGSATIKCIHIRCIDESKSFLLSVDESITKDQLQEVFYFDNHNTKMENEMIPVEEEEFRQAVKLFMAVHLNKLKI